MEAIYKLNTSELDNKLLESIKKLFGRQEVIIQIRSLTDETSYLFDDPENKKHLLESLASEPTVTFSGKEFEVHAKQLLEKSDKPTAE
jgi:hypothetical protein